MDGRKMKFHDSFPFGTRPFFRGELLVSGRVYIYIYYPWFFKSREGNDVAAKKPSMDGADRGGEYNLWHLPPPNH